MKFKILRYFAFGSSPFFIIAGLFLCQGHAKELARPKYGSQATRLFHSHEYIRLHPSPDFWALMPYYLPQQDDRSCSVATVAMVLNAARASQSLTASDELATQSGILKKLNNDVWSKAVGEGGHGVSLDELGQIISDSLKAYGFNRASVTVIHVDESKDARTKLHETLFQNEKSANDFLIVNFLQSEFTGDPEGAVGHIAPVAAYDAGRKRILIFDPDRKWYEPYWVTEETLLKGMATQDKTGAKTRGYVWIKLNP